MQQGKRENSFSERFFQKKGMTGKAFPLTSKPKGFSAPPFRGGFPRNAPFIGKNRLRGFIVPGVPPDPRQAGQYCFF
jgi:hypothetical protein